MNAAQETGRYSRFELPGGVEMDDDFDEELEERVADTIDDLWDRYAHDEWLARLVDEERAGEVLEKIARRVVGGEHPDVVVFVLQCGVELDGT